MPMRTFQVKLYAVPPPSEWPVVQGVPQPPKPPEQPGFTVEARNVDDARDQIKARLVNKGRLRSISSTDATTLSAIVELPSKT